MLNISDKVYMHIKDIEKTINNLGFNKERLCYVKSIDKVADSNGNMVEFYRLQCTESDKEYMVATDDKLWKLTPVDKVVDVIKFSPTFDQQTKEEIVTLLLK